MANRPTPSAAKTLVDCPKCDGKGRISGFDHIVGGRCFECGGACKVEVDTLSDSDAFQMLVNGLGYSAAMAMECAGMGRMDLVDSRLARMVPTMFKVGTDHAREILRFISKGRYWDADANRWGQLDQSTARGLTRRLIEMGRDASDQDACQDSADLERAA